MNHTATPEELQTEADQFKTEFQTLRDAIGQVIVGQEGVVEATLTAILCGGNVLLVYARPDACRRDRHQYDDRRRKRELPVRIS